jgi:CheY-like chemotaxis protein
MTSVYDALYDEDLPGFLCVKSKFWDLGQTDVEVYIRRRSIDGDWIWLASKAVAFINNAEIPAITLEETVVPDEYIEMAQMVNRTTRITAILIQAVEAAWLTEKTNSMRDTNLGESKPAAAMSDESLLLQIINEDAVAYQSVVDAITGTGVHLPDSVQDVQSLVQIAQASAANGGDTLNGNRQQPYRADSDQMSDAANEKSFDPNSVVESVRRGVRLDLGLSRLDPEEVKIITLVLTGRLPVDRVAPLVRDSLQVGLGMQGVASQFTLEVEKQSPKHRLQPQTSLSGSTSVRIPNENPPPLPPPISVLNLSYTYIGNNGMEMLAEALYQEQSLLKTLDISFCGVDEKGLLTLARALARRKRKRIPALRGLILSGNYVLPRAAAELGSALSPTDGGAQNKRNRTTKKISRRTGYDTESSDEDDDEDDDNGEFSGTRKRRKGQKRTPREDREAREVEGLQVLHVAHASMSAEATSRLLEGLGPQHTIRELNLSSNYFGVAGAAVLVKVLETKQRSRNQKPLAAMPFLDRLDMSNNNLGDDGTTQLTRAILKRSEIHLIDLKLSSNSIGAGGIETIMNKLLQHNLVSLSLDKNSIGDQGCQLVAASLQSMQSLSRLNLGFNQIGSRGITSLMRSLVTCKSMTYLGLSGNNLRISGAIALAFTLAQHPRLEELDLDNCCLGQAAQCHIVAGIISNRWVPMKRLTGYAVGPPMVAIGALEPRAANFGNEECFRIRKDEQMKTILQWMETNRTAKRHGGTVDPHHFNAGSDAQNSRFLTPDFVSRTNDVHGTPSQNAYLRLLGWLSRIPFDEDELSALQKYFYESDGGEGERGSDGYINLKLRGDLLAALDEKAADEIREEFPSLSPAPKESVGIDLDKLIDYSERNRWEELSGSYVPNNSDDDNVPLVKDSHDADGQTENAAANGSQPISLETITVEMMESVQKSDESIAVKEKKVIKVKPRITMFSQFEQQLAELKASATELIEQEEDPVQCEIILTQYAEASLTILRQLRYHCMNSGLDGWRQTGLTRKVLIVDDSMVTRKLVSRAFEKANFIVDTACNGAEGVEKLKASLYDIAFMDIDMPVMNGFEATKKLREWEDKMRPGARQPICALTAAYVDDFERSELMKFKEAGLDVMESKPCNIPRLFKVVDDVAPMFSDLSISVMQRERSDHSLHSNHSGTSGLSS